MQINQAKRIVIKTGSRLVTQEASGTARRSWMDSLAQDIAEFRKAGKEVILVTSGAVALGRRALGLTAKSLRLEEKQAAAAAGQVPLFQAWRESLDAQGLKTAQLLLTIEESENRRRYLNASNTLETLLSLGVIPIINENDTVATAELRIGDNDRLAARVAQMASADTLILLSDIDGLYSANPAVQKDARFIPEVTQITPEIEKMAGAAISNVGTGGMVTKLAAAKIALAAGCHMVIMSGDAPHPLERLSGGERCTWFVASASPRAARKQWIGGSIHSAGSIYVDDGAVGALKSGKSLLPAGVKRIEGSFERGDAVLIKDMQGQTLGKGLIAYNAADAARIAGQQSGKIEEILGFKGRDVLIHRDDMVVES